MAIILSHLLGETPEADTDNSRLSLPLQTEQQAVSELNKSHGFLEFRVFGNENLTYLSKIEQNTTTRAPCETESTPTVTSPGMPVLCFEWVRNDWICHI